MRILYLFLLLIICRLAYSQTHAASNLNDYMNQIRSGSDITLNKQSILANPDHKGLIDELSKYYSDTLIHMRYEALSLATQLSLATRKPDLIKQTIGDIVRACSYKNTIDNQILSLLRKYKASDFSATELSDIKALIENTESNVGALCMLYAFAGQASVREDLYNFLMKPNLTKTDKQQIKLALVRSGDENLSTKMHETLTQQVFNDDFIYSALPDILYTKNKMLFDEVLQAILSDAKKCSSANNDNEEPIICAYRLIESIAPFIQNFPATINNRGEIESQDLTKTLADVRAWILTNKSDYIIDQMVY